MESKGEWSLPTLPLEILRCVLSLVEGPDIARLLRSGNNLLRTKLMLPHSIEDVKTEVNLVGSLPSFVRSLEHLQGLHIHVSARRLANQTTSPLVGLSDAPPSLKCLGLTIQVRTRSISLDFALEGILLAEKFPHLTTLVLKNVGIFNQRHADLLPPSLTILEVEEWSVLALLPPSLTVFRAEMTNGSNDIFATQPSELRLPVGLVELKVTPSLFFSIEALLRSLPSSLTKIEIKAELSVFPSNLTYLDAYVDPKEFHKLPYTLQAVRITFTSQENPTIDQILTLPRSLRIINLESGHLMECTENDPPLSFPSLEKWQAYFLRLSRLQLLSLPREGFSSLWTCSLADSDLVHLPQSTTDLQLDYRRDYITISGPYLAHIPSQLRDLRISFPRGFNLDSFPQSFQFPRTLSSLWISLEDSKGMGNELIERYLSAHNQLTSLHFASEKVDDGVACFLPPNLLSLSLTSPLITGEMFGKLSRHITSISFSQCDTIQDPKSQLPQLPPNLRNLVLSGSTLTNDDVEYFPNGSHYTCLQRNTCITSAARFKLPTKGAFHTERYHWPGRIQR